MPSTTAPRSWPGPSPCCCRPRPRPASCRTSTPCRAALLDRTALFYLCTPANPQGAVADLDYLRRAVRLARRHGFVLAVDECYSELWDTAPPPGALEAALAEDGGFDGVVVFHSLSKRSSAAGLRSGFVAGDPDVLARLLRLRAYASPVQPLPLLAAATALWQDEAHVEDNRARYRAKFDLAAAPARQPVRLLPPGRRLLPLARRRRRRGRLPPRSGARAASGCCRAATCRCGGAGAERRLRLHPGGAGRRAGTDRRPPSSRLGATCWRPA